jgi:hypothetical protein
MTKIRPSYVFLALAILLIFVNPLATVAASYNQESSLVAAGVYTSYRVISRLVSMVAETQIEASAVVASVTFMPGKTLQSLLDTLQRFGDMMFPLMIVSGVLGVIIVPVAKLGAGSAALGLIIHLALGHVERISGAFRAQLQRLANGLVSIGILIALIIPGAYAVGYLFGESITGPSWSRAVAAFESFSSEVAEAEGQMIDLASIEEEVVEEVPADGEELAGEGIFSTVLDGITSGASSVASATTGAFSNVVGGAGNLGGQAWDLIAKIPEFTSRVGEIVSASFEFLIAYLIKTIVLPMLIAGLAILLWRRIGVTDHLPLQFHEVKQVPASEAADV